MYKNKSIANMRVLLPIDAQLSHIKNISFEIDLDGVQKINKAYIVRCSSNFIEWN